MPGDWREYVAFLHELADASGAVIRPHFRAELAVVDKTGGADDYDPVTIADRDAEATLRDLIAKRYPSHAILGEEHGRTGDGPETWVIDPIDGTRSFIGGFPTWGTLIAFNDGQRPILGVMDQPVTGERWVGQPDGAFFRGRRLRTRPCAKLEDAVLYSTTPDMFTLAEMECFAEIEHAVKLRRWGGDCYAYVMLAMGFVDLVIESALKPYDIQALIPIVQRAGGMVTTWDGAAADDGGRVVAAGDPRLHQRAVEWLTR